MVPNFFRSAAAAPDLIQQLWGFAKAGYLDNPMPSVFKERLFVWLSRFCPTRYCIVRHVGFCLGGPTDELRVMQQRQRKASLRWSTCSVVPPPWQRDMTSIYQRVEMSSKCAEIWPVSGSDAEDALFACAAVIFVETRCCASAGRPRSGVVQRLSSLCQDRSLLDDAACGDRDGRRHASTDARA